MSAREPGARRRSRAFTLAEMLVALAVLAMLMASAVPTYVDYVRRARITEATLRLTDARVRLEQFFLDHRRYDDGGGACGELPPLPAAADLFALTCTATASAYLVTATGIAGKPMQDFAYTIDHANNHATPAVPSGWVPSDRCWVLRRDGSCN